MLEKIDEKIKPIFEKEVKKVIEIELEKYKVKYPFVGYIIVGMGRVSVSDRDNISLHDTNWKELQKQSKESNLSEDDIFDKLQKQREIANEDDFISFLTNLQYHSIGYQANDMVL